MQAEVGNRRGVCYIPSSLGIKLSKYTLEYVNCEYEVLYIYIQ